MFASLERTAIPGCLLLRPVVRGDARGAFVKTFHNEVFAEHGLADRFTEEYFSISQRGVLRGLHFQLPPHDHAKLVCVLRGSIYDAVVDLRRGSPTYGQYASFELSADLDGYSMLYIPHGLAHGFYAREDQTITLYHCTTVYAPNSDAGVRWDSAGIDWPPGETAPILSERDRRFPALADFDSPFVYEAAS